MKKKKENRDEEVIELNIKNVQKKVARRLRNSFGSFSDLRAFLVRWWCNHYRRPYKAKATLEDLESYTTEDLLIEYLDVFYYQNPEKAEKLLEGAEELEQQAQEEDEEWLKEQMGDDEYLSLEEQEKALKEFEEDIKETTKTLKGKQDNPYANDKGFVDLDEFKD